MDFAKTGKIRVILLFFAVFGAIFSSAACGFRVPRARDALVVHLESDPSTLNPILSTDSAASSVEKFVYESLLDRDNQTLELKPLLASDWQVADDHLTYTFTIRENVKWQDGSPFTVDDVVYSFERIRDPKIDAAQKRSYFADVVGVKKIDDKTIQFKYRRPYFKALEIIGGMPIIPKHIFENGEDFNTHPAGRNPVGTGPYRFKSWQTGTLITLERNSGYWKEEPKISGVVFKIIPSSNVALELLKKGALDFAGLRSIQWEKQTQTPSFTKRFDKYRYWLPNYSYIGWNSRKPYFADRRVRIAMTMMLDRKTILKDLLFGQGEIVSGNFYRYGDAYNEKVEPYAYDPAGARQLLDEAGWIDHDGDGIRDKDGVPFSFTFLYPSGSRFSQSMGIIMREDFMRAGIEMKAQALEWTALLKFIHDRDFDAVSLAWATTFDEDPYQLWHSSQAEKGSNFVGFENAEADKLIEAGRIEFDKSKRIEIYKKLHALIHEEEPYTFLFTNPSLVAVAKRFTNVKAYRAGLDILEWGVTPGPELKEW